MQYMNEPNPGSEEAKNKGCECPVMDNHYGRGIVIGNREPQFWIEATCPVHGLPEYLNEKEATEV